jgi:hypothetical protein
MKNDNLKENGKENQNQKNKENDNQIIFYFQLFFCECYLTLRSILQL